jgi:hypothetical protein
MIRPAKLRPMGASRPNSAIRNPKLKCLPTLSSGATVYALVNNASVDWARLDSNQGPRDYESPALTAELQAPIAAAN